jgi:hypothetical protein
MLLALALLLPLAGCAAPSTTPQPDVAPAAAPPPVDAAPTQPLAFEGMMPAYAEACGWTPVVGQCADAPPTADFSKAIYEPALNGTPAAARVTFTWEAASPANTQMTGFIQDRSDQGVVDLAYLTGASPLTLEVKDLHLKGKLSFVLAGPLENTPDGPGGAAASESPADQPWKLAGNVTLAPR